MVSLSYSSTILAPPNFKSLKEARYKAGHYIIVKMIINQEDITIINIYAPNIEASKYIKQLLTDLKGQTNRNMIILIDGTPLYHPTFIYGEKVNKEIVTFNETLDQMNLINLYKMFHLNAAEYMFLSIV